MRLAPIILFLLFLACSSDKQADFYFVIQPDTIKTVRTFDGTPRNSDDPPPPPPPLIQKVFYGLNNFILTDDSRVFYHDNHVFHRCGTGIDFSKPPRLFITADSLSEINIKDLENFLVNHAPDKNYEDKWFSANISSTTDTIRNPAFKIITDFFKTKNIKYYGVRKLTEEEDYALNSKLNKTPYDPKNAVFKFGFDADYSILADTLSKR